VLDIAENLRRVRQRIAAAAERAGRDPAEVRLVAVTKTIEPGRILRAYQAGVREFGENRVQEAQGKLLSLSQARPREFQDMHWHMVGHLQTNKAKVAVQLFEMIHSVDSLRLAEILSRYAVASGKVIPVLLEVNVAREPTKYGLVPEDLPAVVGQLRELPNLRVEGLMTVAPMVADPEEVRPVFRQLRELRDRLREEFPQNLWPHLSMGMTDDFEVAVEEGATIVRIGRAIFGERTW